MKWALGLGTVAASLKLALSRVMAQRTLVVEVPVERVWQVLTDLRRWPEWNQGVAFVTAERGFPIRLGDNFTWSDGQRMYDSTIYQLQLHRALALTGADSKSTLDLRFELLPAGDGSRTIVIIRESIDGLLPRLLSQVYQYNLENSLEAWLWQIKVAAE